ncbi:MAG: hypothetical protein IGR76_09540 [Synechococcales cyanobacterium T60_A2020_003]|nr:hypothetical protein [Synechococcales cyanobacterium T60_A2020_003]
MLVVLTRDGLVHSSFVQAIAKLKDELQTDYANAIATFRLFAGTATLTGQSYRTQPGLGVSAQPAAASTGVSKNGTRQPVAQATAGDASRVTSRPQPTSVSISGQDVLNALNQISQFTQQYLGATVVSNYLKSSRPAVDWLTQFEIERTGKVTCATLGTLSKALDTAQQQAVQQWITAFTKRCSIVIRDFPNLIQQIDLDERQKSLLFSQSP